jgi:ParB/RepB/Spo0J family partition protein
MTTMKLTTPEVDIAEIHVEEGRNARRRFEEAALKRLAESIANTGIVEPIVIGPAEDGWVLIAGERRLRAARLAGLKKVPVAIREESSRTASFVENVQRERLDPVEEAEGLEALAADLGLGSAKAIAAEVGMSPAWVGVRGRLLKLPEKVRDHVAAGTVPLDAEPQLRKLAAASPRVAECVCEVFAEKGTETGDFVGDLDELIYAVADGETDDPPTMIDPRQVRMSEVIDDAGEREGLASRHLAALGRTAGGRVDPVITLGEVELTVARAAGVLLEHESRSGEFSWSITFLTDREMAVDLVKVAVDREEKEAKKAAKAREKAEEEAEEAGGPPAPAPDDLEREEREAERAAAREEEEGRRRAARSYNERLGHALLKRRGAEGRKKYGLARAKAGAIALVLHDRTLATAGLRLAMPQLQGLQTETDGDGEASYASINQAAEFLIGRIEDARSAAEADELIAHAQIAALLADEDALEAGEWAWRPDDPAEEKVREILAAELADLAPRRSPRQRKVEKDA